MAQAEIIASRLCTIDDDANDLLIQLKNLIQYISLQFCSCIALAPRHFFDAVIYLIDSKI